MPAAINLQKVTVSGWKAIDVTPVEIPFNGESWLIYGGNETGKSSTFSAIRAGLFENPGVTSAFADDWVNNQTPNGAQIELELLIDGEEYTIVKTRGTNKNGNTKLFEGCGGGRTQISTGTDAVNNILELIGAKNRGGAGGRDAEQPQNWGILAWLLAPQGMDSVTPAREQGTQTIGLERAVSTEMIQVEESLKTRFKTQLTPTGKPTAGGTYKMAIENSSSALEQLNEVEAEREKYIHLLHKITQAENSIEKEDGKLTTANDQVDALRGAEVDLTGLDESLATVQGQINTKELHIGVSGESISRLEEISADLNTKMGQLKQFVANIKSAHTLKKKSDENIKANTTEIHSLIEQRKINSEQIQIKQEQMLAAIADVTRTELHSALENLDGKEGELNELLKQGPIVDDDELKLMNDLVSRLDHAEAMLQHISEGMGVSVQLDGDLKATWNIDGLKKEVDSETTFAQEISIQSADFTLNLKKESNEDTDWVKERTDCLSEVEKYSVLSSEDLRVKAASEKIRTNSARTLGVQIETIGSREDLESRIGKLPKQSNVDKDLDLEVLKAETSILLDENSEFETTINNLSEETEPMQKESTTLGEELNGLRAKENATDALAKSAAERRDREIEANGVLETRKELHKKLKNELTRMTNEKSRLKTQKETEVAAANDGLKQAIRIKRHIERELIGKKSDLNTLNDKTEELGGGNLQQAILDANIMANDSKNNLERIERIVRAEEKLLERFAGALNDATAFEIGPIKDQVQIWLGAVTQGKWTQLDMDSKLNVTRIYGPSCPPIEGEKVGSGGLKQVIHALIRLAVACKIHDDKSIDNPDFPAVALVMDESQGHVDDERVRRLVGRFNTEIESGRVQVIALSHRRNEFQSLNALNYNVERREGIDDRDVDE